MAPKNGSVWNNELAEIFVNLTISPKMPTSQEIELNIIWNESMTGAPTRGDQATLYVHLDLAVEEWRQTDMSRLKAEMIRLLSIADASEMQLEMLPGSTVVRVTFQSEKPEESRQRAVELADVFSKRELPQSLSGFPIAGMTTTPGGYWTDFSNVDDPKSGDGDRENMVGGKPLSAACSMDGLGAMQRRSASNKTATDMTLERRTMPTAIYCETSSGKPW